MSHATKDVDAASASNTAPGGGGVDPENPGVRLGALPSPGVHAAPVDAGWCATLLGASIDIAPPAADIAAVDLVSGIDAAGLRSTLDTALTHGPDAVAGYFFSYLFLRHPEIRPLFPVAMDRPRALFVDALTRIVAVVDRPDEFASLAVWLGRLRQVHDLRTLLGDRVREAMVATVAHFVGAGWTGGMARNWSALTRAVEQVIAADSVRWGSDQVVEATVVDVDRRTYDIAVIRVRTDQPVSYRPGQSLQLQLPDLCPGEWRRYSPACAAGRRDVEFHVRLVHGGRVSTALVRAAQPGDRVLLSAPSGTMTLGPDRGRPLLMIAGGTGLAPMRAMIDELTRDGARPTHLFFGARTERENYDSGALAALDREHHWLTVVTAFSDGYVETGRTGLVGDVAQSRGPWAHHDIHVCGPPPMVETTVRQLTTRAAAASQARGAAANQARGAAANDSAAQELSDVRILFDQLGWGRRDS